MGDHAFISYSRSEQDFAIKLAEGLRDHGVLVWLDTWNITPSEDWDIAIEDGLRGCAICVIVLSPAAVSSLEVRGELHAALANRKPILPILYRACEVPRQLRLIQYVDLTGPEALTDTVLEHLAQVLLRRAPIKPHQEGFLDERELRNRRDILGDVRAEIADRLGQSLETAAPLVLLKEKQPHQVDHPWDETTKIPRFRHTSPPSSMSIVEAFDDPVCARKLLILGGPGGGKSTALLQLASELTVRAEANADAPVPVIFSLPSWRHHTSNLATWIVDEMKIKYGMRKAVANQWLNDRALALLLDGLDEVPSENQAECVRAINQFGKDYRPRQLVVCCRLAEYENLGIKLQLGSAIYLVPLDDTQIRDYLERTNSGDLWRTISADPESKELTRAPLFLSMMAFAYHEISSEDWRKLSTLSDRRAYLIDTYIRHLFSQRAGTVGYADDDTRTWLAWLARMLKTQEHEELLIERIEPNWLPPGKGRGAYRVVAAVAVFAAIVCAITVLNSLSALIPKGVAGTQLHALMVRVGATWWSSSQGDLFLKVAIALVPAIVIALRSRIVPVETLRWSGRSALDGLARCTRQFAITGIDRGAFCGLIVGALYGAAQLYRAESMWTSTSEVSRRAGIIAGTITGLLATAALAGTPRLSTWFRKSHHRWFSLRGADALLAGLVFPLGAVATGLPGGIVAGFCVATLTILCSGISDSAAASISKGTIIGFTAWLGVAWQFARMAPVPAQLIPGLLMAGVGAATLTAVVSGIRVMLQKRNSSHPTEGPGPQRFPMLLRRWARWIAVGLLGAIAGGLAVAALNRAGAFTAVQSTALMVLYLATAQTEVLAGSWAIGLSFGIMGALIGAFSGALVGMLNGVTGPDVERRSVPNQGIRQSARNVAICALIGTLVIGLPYGIINVVAVSALTRTVPDTLDWLRLGFGSAALVGALGGLVPGAACIQHFSLRLVMWYYGLAPLRYDRFLNYATSRMFLQRIGGRYRFLHSLLRDRFTQLARTPMVLKSDSRR